MIEKALKHFEPPVKTQSVLLGGGNSGRSKPILADYETIGMPVYLEPLYEGWLHFAHGAKYSGDKQSLNRRAGEFAEMFYLEIAINHPRLFHSCVSALGEDADQYSVNLNPSYCIVMFRFLFEIVLGSRVGKDRGLQHLCQRFGLHRSKLNEGRPLRRSHNLIKTIAQYWDDEINECIR